MSSVGEKIRRIRKELRLTQEDIAGEEFTKSYISQIERGIINPSLKALKYIAEKLNKPMSYFVDNIDELEKEEKESINKIEEILDLILEGEALFNSNDLEKSYDIFNRLLSVSLSKEVEIAAAISSFYLGRIYLAQNKFKDALSHFEQAIHQFKKLQKFDRLADSYFHLGITYKNLGEYKKAYEQLQKGLAVIDEKNLNIPTLKAKHLVNIASLNYTFGKYQMALDYYTKGLEYSMSYDLWDYVALAYKGIGICHLAMKNYRKSQHYIRKALLLYKLVDSKYGIALIYNNLGVLNIHMKNLDRALKYLETSTKLFRELDKKFGEGRNLTEIARIHYYQEQYDIAIEFCKRALKIIELINDVEEKGRIYDLIGKIYMALQNYTKAEENLLIAFKLFEENNMTAELSETCSTLGELYINMNQPQKAKEYYNKSINLLKGNGTKNN